MADLDIDALIAAQAPQFFDPFDPANNPTPLVLRSLPGEEGRPRGLLGRVLDYAENGGGVAAGRTDCGSGRISES